VDFRRICIARPPQRTSAINSKASSPEGERYMLLVRFATQTNSSIVRPAFAKENSKPGKTMMSAAKSGALLEPECEAIYVPIRFCPCASAGRGPGDSKQESGKYCFCEHF
jgi:hypothetical protein